MELIIYNIDDRMQVAQILIKNGYTVSQRKRSKTPNGKTVEYYLQVEKDDNNAETTR